jgi:hypothetical protein
MHDAVRDVFDGDVHVLIPAINVFRWKFSMLMVMNWASTVGITLLRRHFIVVMSAVGVPALLGKSIQWWELVLS